MSADTPAQAGASARFWRFSLATYGRPGVAVACVALQDRWGLDVNLLLWCCWHGAERRRLSPEDVKRAIDAARPWQSEVVQPLRALRRMLKPGVPGIPQNRVEVLRGGLKKVELEAEHIAQMTLAELAVGGTMSSDTPAAVARVNLDTYLTLRNVAPEPEDRAALDALVSALSAP